MTLLVGMFALMLGHLVKGVTGFGSAIVAIPLVSLVVPPAEAILLVTATDLVAGSWLAWRSRALVHLKALAAIIPPLFLAQWVGTDLLAWLPVQTAQRALAVLVGWFAVSMILRPVRPEGHADRADATSAGALVWASVAGTVAGLLSGLFGMPGPPVVAWVRRYLSDAAGRALLLAVFVPSSWALVAMILSKGIVPVGSVWLALALIPASLVGASVGARLAGSVAPAVFGRAVGALLLVAAVGLLVR